MLVPSPFFTASLSLGLVCNLPSCVGALAIELLWSCLATLGLVELATFVHTFVVLAMFALLAFLPFVVANCTVRP